jgi:hypothetical protein
VVFSLGPDHFGFLADDFLNYHLSTGSFEPVQGAPEYVLGRIQFEKRSVLVQDLRVRFGQRVARAITREALNVLIFQDRHGQVHGFAVDAMLDFCSGRLERGMPWGVETLIDGTPYKAYVDRWVEAKIDHTAISFWLLRHEELYVTC